MFSILILYPNWNTIAIINLILLPIIHFYVGGSYGSLWCSVINLVVVEYLIKY